MADEIFLVYEIKVDHSQRPNSIQLASRCALKTQPRARVQVATGTIRDAMLSPEIGTRLKGVEQISAVVAICPDKSIIWIGCRHLPDPAWQSFGHKIHYR
jgi:hypothetical protein